MSKCRICDLEARHHNHSHKKIDKLLYSTLSLVILFYIIKISSLIFSFDIKSNLLVGLTDNTYMIMNKMWFGIGMGIVASGLISKVPQELVISLFGKQNGVSGIIRASIIGVLLDTCSHGVLIIGMQLYKKGITLGQTMAFLIASPWNSISLTFIMWSMIGLKWTLVFIFASMLIAIASGLIFDWLVKNGKLPENSNRIKVKTKEKDIKKFVEEVKDIENLKKISPLKEFFDFIFRGVSESKMVLRWIFLGILISVAVGVFVSPSIFQTVFAPTLIGLFLTLGVATIMEVCSEGSIPIAADIINNAGSLGNGFTFLMAGIATDYTEMAAIKETTGRWKISFALPLVTVPQIMVISYMLNML